MLFIYRGKKDWDERGRKKASKEENKRERERERESKQPKARERKRERERERESNHRRDALPPCTKPFRAQVAQGLFRPTLHTGS